MKLLRWTGVHKSEGLSHPKVTGTGAARGLAARSDDTDVEGYSPSTRKERTTNLSENMNLYSGTVVLVLFAHVNHSRSLESHQI